MTHSVFITQMNHRLCLKFLLSVLSCLVYITSFKDKYISFFFIYNLMLSICLSVDFMGSGWARQIAGYEIQLKRIPPILTSFLSKCKQILHTTHVWRCVSVKLITNNWLLHNVRAMQSNQDRLLAAIRNWAADDFFQIDKNKNAHLLQAKQFSLIKTSVLL